MTVGMLQGKLCCIDTGLDSCLHDTLLMDGLQITRTVLESDFGMPLCDINYFDSLTYLTHEQRLFIC